MCETFIVSMEHKFNHDFIKVEVGAMSKNEAIKVANKSYPEHKARQAWRKRYN